MKGNELELWITSLTTCNFIIVQSNRWMLIVNKHCAIFTNSIKWTLGKVPRFHCMYWFQFVYVDFTVFNLSCSFSNRFFLREQLINFYLTICFHRFQLKRKLFLVWVRYCQWRRFRKSQYAKADFHFRQSALPRYNLQVQIDNTVKPVLVRPSTSILTL